MPKIVILPHQDLCPDGAVLEANSGETILDAALRNGIEIEHACEKSCACTTCHCIVRLSCQARVTDEDLVVEIPRYTINHAREH